MEIWKDVIGYEGRYQVSSEGRIRSLPTKSRTKYFSGDIIKQFQDKAGYMAVGLSRKIFKVHRIVATAFIENPNNYPCVNHKDENKTNNKIENLEWCTHRYNSNYGTRNKRISQNSGRMIVQYDLNGNEVKRWKSIADAARYYGVERTTICGCCANRQHTSCGYIWKYADV